MSDEKEPRQRRGLSTCQGAGTSSLFAVTHIHDRSDTRPTPGIGNAFQFLRDALNRCGALLTDQADLGMRSVSISW